MKQWIGFAALALLVPALAAAQNNPYRWTLSSSATDPLANSSVAPAGGITSLYLWMDCPLLQEGVAAAEFSLSVTGAGNQAIAVTPQPGFLNATALPDMLLAMPCQTNTALAAQILVVDVAPGEYCLAPSVANGVNVSVDCTNFQTWGNEVVGFHNNGGFPCDTTNQCRGLSVEPETWGSVKALYR